MYSTACHSTSRALASEIRATSFAVCTGIERAQVSKVYLRIIPLVGLSGSVGFRQRAQSAAMVVSCARRNSARAFASAHAARRDSGLNDNILKYRQVLDSDMASHALLAAVET